MNLTAAKISNNGELERQTAIDVQELEYIAFSGRDDLVHGIFRSLTEVERRHYSNKYILHQTISGGIKKLRTFLSSSAEEAAEDEKKFIDGTVSMFVSHCRENGTQPREIFESLIQWGEELSKLSLLQEALYHFRQVGIVGGKKFPDLYVRAILGQAAVMHTMGKHLDSERLLSSLISRPYAISDRNLFPEILRDLGKQALLRGNVEYYKGLLFWGLRHFYTNLESRRMFVDQVLRTYKRSYNVLLDNSLSLTNRFLFAVHFLYFRTRENWFVRTTRVSSILRLMVLGYVYTLNYIRKESIAHPDIFTLSRAGGEVETNKPGENIPRLSILSRRTRRNILITRAMGGIGDLLMMTPGIHALKTRYPGDQIHLAIPKRYFPLFAGNADVTLLNIDEGAIDHLSYRKWYNFTDCPAARIESRTAPKVRKSRIDIFGSALGVPLWGLWKMKKQPRYFISDAERQFQKQFWRDNGLAGKTVVGIQLHSDEVYRDFPNMKDVVQTISQKMPVLIFDGEKILGYEGKNIVPVAGLPLRLAFALAAGCNAIVAPDSAFVHLAAALNIPCVALFGPIDGRVRTKHYPNCRFLDSRANLGCLPCWRNDQIPCKLTNMRTSVCMGDISIREISDTLSDLLENQANNE